MIEHRRVGSYPGNIESPNPRLELPIGKHGPSIAPPTVEG